MNKEQLIVWGLIRKALVNVQEETLNGVPYGSELSDKTVVSINDAANSAAYHVMDCSASSAFIEGAYIHPIDLMAWFMRFEYGEGFNK